jgi:DNA-binding transcriptional LysR family regulator
VRVTCPHDFASRVVAPVVGALVVRYPSLVVDIDADDGRRDLIAGRFDVAIRAGRMDDSSYSQRRLLVDPEVIVATPELAKRFTHATRPRELVGAPWVTHSMQSDGAWSFHDEKSGERDDLEVRASARANSAAVMLALAVRGVGFCSMPVFVFADDAAHGRLVRVFPDWLRRHLAVYAVLPSRKNPPARATIFLDALAASLVGSHVS